MADWDGCYNSHLVAPNKEMTVLNSNRPPMPMLWPQRYTEHEKGKHECCLPHVRPIPKGGHVERTSSGTRGEGVQGISGVGKTAERD